MRDSCWLLDLDGVVWRADEPIAGSARAVEALRRSGRRVACFTNNSYPLLAAHVDKLASFGVEMAPEDVLTSAQAAARCVEPGERALVLGGPGIVEALQARKVDALVVSDEQHATGPGRPEADVVVVGIDPDLTYRRLAVAASVLRAGARFVATNDDATFPMPDGLVPGAGALVAALSVASGREPLIAGKPHRLAVELALRRLAAVTTVVGDRASTDGLLAKRLGARFALVWSGVTPKDHERLEVEPDLEAEDLVTLVTGICA